MVSAEFAKQYLNIKCVQRICMLKNLFYIQEQHLVLPIAIYFSIPQTQSLELLEKPLGCLSQKLSDMGCGFSSFLQLLCQFPGCGKVSSVR